MGSTIMATYALPESHKDVSLLAPSSYPMVPTIDDPSSYKTLWWIATLKSLRLWFVSNPPSLL